MDSETVATVKNRLSWTPALLCVLASILPAQVETPKPYTVAIEGEDIVMTVNENLGMPMKDFIKIAETHTGMLFVFPKTEVENDQNKIVWIGTVRLAKGQFFAFFPTTALVKPNAVFTSLFPGGNIPDHTPLMGGNCGPPGSAL